jgi:ATP-dependent Clp protease adaptor protein ClpS
MAEQEFDGNDGELAVEDAKPRVKRPPLYQVVVLNDDYTPMDFVVHVLQKFFHMDENSAERIMLQIHHQGKGICGTFSREIAETKVAQVNSYARENQHPLLCTMEQV